MRVIPFWRRGDWLSIYADEAFDEKKSGAIVVEEDKKKTQ
jgi:hypothetical protein